MVPSTANDHVFSSRPPPRDTGTLATHHLLLQYQCSLATCINMTCVQFGVKTSSVLICCLYLVFHAAFLVINFVMLNEPREHVEHIVRYLRGRDQQSRDLSIYESSNYFIEV